MSDLFICIMIQILKCGQWQFVADNSEPKESWRRQNRVCGAIYE